MYKGPIEISRSYKLENRTDDESAPSRSTTARDVARAPISHPRSLSLISTIRLISRRGVDVQYAKTLPQAGRGVLRECRVADASKTAAAAAITDHNTSSDTSTNATSLTHTRLTGCTQNEAYEKSLYITQ